MKDRDRGISNSLHESPDNSCGFTLIEVLASTLILSIILAALLITFNIGNLSNTLSTAKVDLQANVRQIIDMIANDVRQTNLIQINTNAPSVNHIKFQQVTGIDNTTGNYTLSPNYIEYTYDTVLATLTRSTVAGSRVFTGITQSPFYSEVGIPLAWGGILTSKKLVIIISGRSQVRGALIDFSLTGEVKVRNE